MARQVHFVITIDLDDKTKTIDDETLCAKFHDGTTWDTDEAEWVFETDEEYEEALTILNDKSKELK